LRPEVEILERLGLAIPNMAISALYASPTAFLENFYVYFILRRAALSGERVLALALGDDFERALYAHLGHHKYNMELYRLVRQGAIKTESFDDVGSFVESLERAAVADGIHYVYALLVDPEELSRGVALLKRALKRVFANREPPLLIGMFADDSLLSKDWWRPVRYLSDVEFIVRAQEALNAGELVVSRVKLGLKPEGKLSFAVTETGVSFQIQLKA